MKIKICMLIFLISLLKVHGGGNIEADPQLEQEFSWYLEKITSGLKEPGTSKGKEKEVEETVEIGNGSNFYVLNPQYSLDQELPFFKIKGVTYPLHRGSSTIGLLFSYSRPPRMVSLVQGVVYDPAFVEKIKDCGRILGHAELHIFYDPLNYLKGVFDEKYIVLIESNNKHLNFPTDLKIKLDDFKRVILNESEEKGPDLKWYTCFYNIFSKKSIVDRKNYKLLD